MRKKKIALITGTDGTRNTLLEQLDSYIGDFSEIESYVVDMGIEGIIRADMAVVSSYLILDDAAKHICEGCPIILARRVINYSEIEKMLSIPGGETILFVNDCRETTEESIEWLKKLGVDNYNYIPYYPGCTFDNEDCKESKDGKDIKVIRDVKVAVTPGETAIVPSSIKNVIDIGPRLIDITTITEILKELNVFEEKWEYISTKYIGKIIDMGKRLTEITREKTENYNHIIKVIDSVNEGLLAYNYKGDITVFNENLKYFLGIRRNNIIGKNIKQVINDKRILDFLTAGKIEETIFIETRGEKLQLTKFQIKEDKITVIIFKNVVNELEEEKKAAKELYSKGYYGKYNFEDIVGQSAEIIHTKKIAEKLAATDLTVLIEGKSGTGKELFASAIHNASGRRNKPFVAVNFSSLSENLVESELFGYDEGAFTGANKGGKPGLFEQAQGGTIFLDEIGDISPRVQSRLLRVLQEKEIMRVGGEKIISVDVRIISATNQNLNRLVEKGEFRSDLYHRLKVLYLKLPALKDRKEDILPLISTFMRQKGKEDIKIEEEVIKKLVSYDWYGNVRELKNTLDYMLAVCNDRFICLQDLPEESFFLKGSSEKVDSVWITKEYYNADIEKLQHNSEKNQVYNSGQQPHEELGNKDNIQLEHGLSNSANEQLSYDSEHQMDRSTTKQMTYKDEIEGRGDYLFILKALHDINIKGQWGSRNKLLTLAKINGIELTEQMIRNRLKDLERLGYVKKRIGKSGTVLTAEGAMRAKIILDEGK